MAPSLESETPTDPPTPKIISTCCTGEVQLESNGTDMSAAPNPSLQVTADHKIKMVAAPIRKPGPGEVLIHVKVTGICGSDIHFWKAGKIGTLTVDGDYILGHEAAGIVVQLGPGVNSLKVGDRVAIEPGVPCSTCFFCTTGRYNLCSSVQFAGAYPYDGTCQRFKVHPARWAHKIPDTLSYSQAALLEPLSVGLHALSRLPHPLPLVPSHNLGQPLVVFGAGPIGLVTLACAKASGYSPVCITDIEPSRLEFARKFVPGTWTYLVKKGATERENAEGVRQVFAREGDQSQLKNGVNGMDTAEKVEIDVEAKMPAVVMECTGVGSSIVTAAYTARRGGCVMVVGVGRDILDGLPFMHISLAEINLHFTNRYASTWPAGIELLNARNGDGSARLNLDAMVTHTFPLEEATEAMALCSDTSKGSVKIHVVDERDIDPNTIPQD